MKCPKCGHTWYELTEEGEKVLDELGWTKEDFESEVLKN
ncbi:unnamed protein product, partial [marine sediment metagenome]